MTHELDIERLLDRWFIDGPTSAPDRLVDVVSGRIEHQAQRGAWRRPRADAPVRTRTAVAAVAAVVVTAVIAGNFVGGVPTAQPGASPSASPSPTPSPTPSFAPLGDGLIVYEHVSAAQSPTVRLEYVLPDRRGRMVMPEETGIQVGPAWSPDGTRLMYAGTSSDAADARGGIWETTAEGSEPRLISTDCKPPTCVEEIDPSLSADGTLLAFIRQVGTETDAATSFVVAIRDLATGAVTELEATRQPAGLVMHRHPRWSPDGVRIVFHSLTFGTGSRQEDSDIFVINVDGTGLRQVSPDSIVAGDADWSPDGTTIVFTSKPIHEWGYHDFGERHIYTMAPDGSNLRRLDPNGWWAAPSWTPDGRRILFTEGSRPQGLDVHNIMVMDRDGSNVQTIATFADCCRWYAVQQPSPN